ncbi:hypothetical protein LMG18101_05254 [Ralstonia flaminis]|uniref:Uncharacterized protein n=1 Tax=Ralstonia flaminis TaxID=3058597 RepID=A0ABM9KBK7_9RALS|nr:hypothetical protein LMG18101_05254 [Ralstonia sp. LMG 18101]
MSSPLITAVPLAGGLTMAIDENGPPVALAVACTVTGALDSVVVVIAGAVPITWPTTRV